MSLTAGSRVGQYEVAEAIGAGGMGVVFRARDHALGRDVAIKILPQAVSDDPERRQRFAREARLLAAVNHAHIALVYGIEDRGGPPNLFLRDLVTGTERRLLQSPRFHFATDVSPDGKVVAYQQRTERGNSDLMQVRLDDTSKVQPVFATSASEMDLRFAPTGGRMAFVSDESGRPEVYVAPFPSTSPKTMVSSGGGFLPRWRRDGRELYFVSPSGTLMVATTSDDGRPGHPQPLFSAAGWANYDVMDNGARFVAIVRQSVGYEQPLTILLNWQVALGIQ